MSDFDSDYDLAFGGEPENGPSGQEESEETTQTGENTEGTGNQNSEEPTGEPQSPGKAEGESEEAKPVELPEEYKPFESLLKSTKWDHADPKALSLEALKAYDHLQRENHRTQNKSHFTQQENNLWSDAVAGSIEDLNKVRSQRGLAEFPIPKSWDDQEKEWNELSKDIVSALNGDQESVKRLDQFFSDKQKSVIEGRAKAQAAKPHQKTNQDFLKNAQEVVDDLKKANPETETYLNEISEWVDKGGFLRSMGIDAAFLLSDPKRAQVAAEVGEALHLKRNFDEIVSKRVKAEVDKVKRSKGLSPETKGKPRETPSTNGQANDYESELLAMVD
jgi:chorismate mutase